MTTAEFAEWFSEAMTGSDIPTNAPSGPSHIDHAEPVSTRRVSVKKEEEHVSVGVGSGHGCGEHNDQQQPQQQPQVAPSAAAAPGTEIKQENPNHAPAPPQAPAQTVEDAHLMRLVPEQEMNVSFPVGCPVWFNIRSHPSDDGSSATFSSGIDVTHGIVKSIFLHTITQNVVYKIEKRHANNETYPYTGYHGVYTTLEAVFEENIAFAAKCPVFLRMEADQSRQFEGEIILPRLVTGNDGKPQVSYIVNYSLDENQIQVKEGVTADKITFRRVPYAVEPPVPHPHAPALHHSIHGEIPSTNPTMSNSYMDTSNLYQSNDSSQDADVANEYLLALSDDQIKFSPPHSYSASESPAPIPVTNTVDSATTIGGNSGNNNKSAIAPPPSQPQPPQTPPPQAPIPQHRPQQHYLAPVSNNPNLPPGKLVESGAENTGRWTKKEHELFLAGLQLYGKQWKKVAEHVKTRTTIQVRTHAQKYFKKLQKDQEESVNGGNVGGAGSNGNGVIARGLYVNGGGGIRHGIGHGHPHGHGPMHSHRHGHVQGVVHQQGVAPPGAGVGINGTAPPPMGAAPMPPGVIPNGANGASNNHGGWDNPAMNSSTSPRKRPFESADGPAPVGPPAGPPVGAAPVAQPVQQNQGELV